MLSPISIARDRKLRALYEAIIAAKGTPEEAAAREAFARFSSGGISVTKTAQASVPQLFTLE